MSSLKRQYNHAESRASWPSVAAFTRPTQSSANRVGLWTGSRQRPDGSLWVSFSSKTLSQRRFKSENHKITGGNPEDDASQSNQEHAEATSRTTGAAATGKHFIDRLSHIPRPTKQDFLAAANGFWHRLAIHFKWFSIRSVRPFNFDEIFAFASWIFWGHVLWIIIGTTTFVSLAILAVNTVFAQETLAGWVGNYLTKSSGIKVVFESAIVPKWKNGVITFNNVFVSRRPGTERRERAVSKGSSTAAAAAAAAASQAERGREELGSQDDGNYTQFDVTIDTVNVTLSFSKYFNGKGLLRDVDVHGVRGVVDRTSVVSTGDLGDPKSYRHEHHTGDFEIDDFRMEDVLLTVYQPRGFRPFTVSIFNCELPRLRKQWLFYDFLSANNMSGSFDNSLFTIHPRQVHNYTGAPLIDGEETEPSQWKKQSRLRIDGLKIDHLNRGVGGPFSWIHEGDVDIVADVMLPNDKDIGLAKVMSDFYDRMEATVQHVNSPRRTPRPQDNIIYDGDSDDGTPADQKEQQQPDPRPAARREDRYVIYDIRIHLNDVRASVPLFNNDLSYVKNALVRPIVAYINSKRSFIPVTCRIVKRSADFDGSWTVFDSGLLDDLSREIYDAFVRDIMDGERRSRRIRKVGLWTLQVAAQALFVGLAGQLV